LEELILARWLGREDPENCTAGDLAAVTNFTWRAEATQDCQQMELRAGMRLLDVGAGLAGRHATLRENTAAELRDRLDGRVCARGRELTKRTKLDGLRNFGKGAPWHAV